METEPFFCKDSKNILIQTLVELRFYQLGINEHLFEFLFPFLLVLRKNPGLLFFFLFWLHRAKIEIIIGGSALLQCLFQAAPSTVQKS